MGNWGCLAIKYVGNYSRIHDRIGRNITYVHVSAVGCVFLIYWYMSYEALIRLHGVFQLMASVIQILSKIILLCIATLDAKVFSYVHTFH